MYGEHFADLKDLSTKRRLCGSGGNPFELLDSISQAGKVTHSVRSSNRSLFPVTRSAHTRPAPESFDDLVETEEQELEPDYDAIWAANRAQDEDEEAELEISG